MEKEYFLWERGGKRLVNCGIEIKNSSQKLSWDKIKKKYFNKLEKQKLNRLIYYKENINNFWRNKNITEETI